MNGIVSPQILYIEAKPPMWLLGEGAFREVLKVKWDPEGWTLIQEDWCPHKKRKIHHISIYLVEPSPEPWDLPKCLLPLSSVLELIWIIGYPADVTEHACCGGKSPKYLVTRNIRGKVFCVNSNGDIRERNSREEAGCSLERKRKTKFFLFSYKTVLFSG